MSHKYSLAEMHKLKRHLQSKIRISELTRKNYLAKFNTVARHSLDDFCRFAKDRNLSKTSFYAYKAAYQYGMVAQLGKMLGEYNTCKRAGDHHGAEECRAAAEACCKALKNLNPDYAIRHINDPAEHASQYPGESTGSKSKKKNSKRNSLSGLPVGWQDQIHKHVAPKYKSSVLALTVTGCRPEELRKGLRFFLSEDELIGVRIDGAKVTETKGQRIRKLYFDPEINELNRVIKKILDVHGPITIKLPESNPDNPDPPKTVNAFGRAVKYAASKAGPKFSGVSPYTFRHQKTSDLKKEGLSKEQRAAFLGHRSTRTQQQYGFAQQGRGASGIRRIEISKPIRNGVEPLYSRAPVRP